MGKPGKGGARAARGFAMSAACLLLAVAAHVAAGGSIPVNAEFVFAAALLSTACVALADRRRGPVEIGAVVAVSQLGLHLLLTVAEHGHAAATTGGAGMVVGHVVAAAVLILLLSGAESNVWAMASLSATVLLRRIRALLTPSPLAHQAMPAAASPERLFCTYPAVVVRATPRRGPPAAVLALTTA